ncbi:MAG TPA: Fur family transcriptional regulator [Candidatus Limnocylindrales bacterium]|jgi:Fur family ferric uptake transcriptional regulator
MTRTAMIARRSGATAIEPVTSRLVRALDIADVRVTEPRRVVLELIAARGGGHFAAADLVDDARIRGVHIGRATIFRTLDLFLASGIIERLDLPDGEHAYVACAPSHHHHVVCTVCGRSTGVEDGGLRAVTTAVERATGYVIDGHRLELYGQCPSCHAGGGG